MSTAPIGKVIPALTFSTNVPASQTRQTCLVDVSALALFTISFKANRAMTIKVYQHHVASPKNKSASNNLLVFEEAVPKNTVFYKRLTIKGNYAQFEVVNNEALSSVAKLTTCGLTIPNFEAQTFLNSTIGINDNSALSRVGNDFTLDLIRGIHSSFKKINVLGITNQHVSETIGLGTLSYSPATAETLYVSSTSTDDGIGGVGARDVIMEYIDGNGVEQTYTIILQGNTILNLGITGVAVNSLKVSNAGGQASNQGTISVYTDNNIANLLAHIRPQDNLSRVASYRVPATKSLVLNDINISGYSAGTTLEVIERASGIDYKIGEFQINTGNQQLMYRLDTKVNAGSSISVRQVPISSTGADTLINININGMLCPTINNF